MQDPTWQPTSAPATGPNWSVNGSADACRSLAVKGHVLPRTMRLLRTRLSNLQVPRGIHPQGSEGSPKPAQRVTTRMRMSWLSPRGHALSLMEMTVSLSMQGKKNLWWGRRGFVLIFQNHCNKTWITDISIFDEWTVELVLLGFDCLAVHGI